MRRYKVNYGACATRVRKKVDRRDDLRYMTQDIKKVVTRAIITQIYWSDNYGDTDIPNEFKFLTGPQLKALIEERAFESYERDPIFNHKANSIISNMYTHLKEVFRYYDNIIK